MLQRLLIGAVLGALMLASAVSNADSVSVVIDGVSGELEKNARAFISFTALADRSDLSEAAIRRLHRRAPEQIRNALQAFGYYDATVKRNIVRADNGVWTATYTVSPGTPVRLRNVAVGVTGPGRDSPAVKEALANHMLVPGSQLRHDQYEAAKSALRRGALNDGYLDASFSNRVLQVNPGEGYADIDISLSTGPRFSIGQITIDQDALSDELVRRFIALTEGDAFSQSKLLDAQYALQDSGYYAVVEVTAQRELADNLRVPVHISATSRKPQRYSFGLGYGSDVGPRISLGWEHRLINKRGHRTNADIRVSTQRTEFSTRYSIPIGDPRSERYVLSFAHRSEDLGDDTTSRRQELGATQTRVLGDWQRNLYLQLTRELSDIAGTSSTDTLLLPGVTFTRTSSDSLVQPTNGRRISADLRGSHSALGSDTNFLRLKLETRLIRPIGPGRLLLRGDVGTTRVGQFSQLPASQRFFAGGDRSVRGYGFNELGPRDADGLNIGGHHFLTASIELEWPVAGRWSTAVFVDAGNAFNTFGDPLEYSVGIGGRLRTPVGVVRLDLAKPVSEGGQSIRMHLGLGPDL